MRTAVRWVVAGGVTTAGAAAVAVAVASPSSEQPSTAVRLFRDVTAVCKIALVYRARDKDVDGSRSGTEGGGGVGGDVGHHEKRGSAGSAIDHKHAQGATILLDLCRRNGGVYVADPSVEVARVS